MAADLFLEHGYAAVSMRDIATKAGMSHGGVYGHFRSKGQLLVEVIRWLLAEREHSPEYTETLTRRDDAITILHDKAGRTIRLLEVDAAAAARHDPDVAAGMGELYADRLAAMRHALDGAAEDPEMTAWFLMAVAAGVGVSESIGLRLPTPDQFRDAVVKMLASEPAVEPP